MSLELTRTKIDKQKVGFFRFKELNSKSILTNDIGEYCFLSPQEFDLFLSGKIDQIPSNRLSELKSKGFIRDNLDFDGLAIKYATKNMFLGQGPCLHIVVVTLRCDHKCLYCQTSSQNLQTKHLDMDIATAQKVINTIFESPSKFITIEFQGGEPLVNWGAVKFIIEYAQEKNKVAKKKLLISLVSNFTFMNQKRLEFLINNNIAICTSLDGPQILHNKNRTSKGRMNSYKNTIKWFKQINKKIKRNRKYKYKVNALATITKSSLSYPKRIIDEYVSLGIETIHLRQVNPFGLSKEDWSKISVSAKEFIDFYRKALDYIIELNLKGKKFYERTAKIFLTKILLNKDPNFLDIRSPCGAGIGQLAYNFNGNVYTCDEGRMLSAIGDESFYLGKVGINSYEELINNEVVKTMCLSSCLDNLTSCSECVYNPYCGVCPIYNYVTEGNIFSTYPFNERCKINMSILDYLFEKLEEPSVLKIFNSWVKNKEQVI